MRTFKVLIVNVKPTCQPASHEAWLWGACSISRMVTRSSCSTLRRSMRMAVFRPHPAWARRPGGRLRKLDYQGQKCPPLRKNQRCRQPEYSGRILCIRKGSKISLQRRLGRTGRNARSTVERAKSCMASAPRRVRSLGRTGRRTRVRKALPCLLEKSGIHTFLHDLIASFQVNSFGKEDSWIHSTSSKLTYLASTIWRLNMLPTWLSIVHAPDDGGSRADLESGKSRSGCSSGFFGLQTKYRSRIVLQILNFNQSISTERQSADPKNWASNSQSSTLQRRVAEFPHLTQTVFYMD